jgi:hypothetical protein
VIAPARPFSAAEREAVRGFVEAGGTLLCMVGAQEAAGSRELLADFAFTVPPSPVPPGSEIPEPEPLGAFRQTYTGTGKEAWYVQCYAGWEVTCDSPEARPLILWSDAKTNRPFVLKRPFGRGVVAVIGDSYFAVNENLESAANQVTDNVRFWRWLLTRITPQTPWDPPPPKPEAKPGEADAAKPAADAVKPAADSSDEDSAGEEAGP